MGICPMPIMPPMRVLDDDDLRGCLILVLSTW